MTGHQDRGTAGRGERCDFVNLREGAAMFDLNAVQQSLAEFGLDGWLLYDFRGSNVLARRVLGLDQKPTATRRFFYFIPAEGDPQKLVHRIETGRARRPARRQDGLPALAGARSGRGRAAQGLPPGRDGILPRAIANPYVSKVDAGTVELVRVHRRRGRLLGRPDPALRGDLGRRPVGRCTARPSSSRPRPRPGVRA